VLLTMFLIAGQTFAADDSVGKNNPTYKSEYDGKVRYYGTVSTTVAGTDSVGIDYTKACFIANLNSSNAYFYTIMTNSTRGTEDANISVQYSLDRTTWFLGSQASGVIKDQQSTTATIDTLNVQTGVTDPNYDVGLYVRLKWDYQAANPAENTGSWSIVFTKPTGLYGKKLARVEDCLD